MDLAMASALTAASILGIAAAPVMLARERLRRLANAFAAGTLLAMLVCHILPEALLLSGAAGTVAVLAGFVAMMLVHQHVLTSDPCCDHQHVQHAGLPSFLALTLCSVNDGLILLGADAVGPWSPVLWSLCVHKATAGFALFLLLRDVATQSAALRRTYLTLFVLVSPAVYLAAGGLEFAHALPYVLGAAGGALLYVVAGSMVPKVEHLARGWFWPVLGAFVGAVVLTVGIEFASGHEHGPDHDHDHSHEAR